MSTVTGVRVDRIVRHWQERRDGAPRGSGAGAVDGTAGPSCPTGLGHPIGEVDGRFSGERLTAAPSTSPAPPLSDRCAGEVPGSSTRSLGDSSAEPSGSVQPEGARGLPPVARAS